MAVRRRFRFVERTLTADREPDTPPIRHLYRCLGEDEDGRPCGAEGPVCEDFSTAQQRPSDHLKSQQEHRSYGHFAEVPWLLLPNEEPN